MILGMFALHHITPSGTLNLLLWRWTGLHSACTSPRTRAHHSTTTHYIWASEEK